MDDLLKTRRPAKKSPAGWQKRSRIPDLRQARIHSHSVGLKPHLRGLE